MKEYKIGEEFELDGKRYKCTEEVDGCDGCVFNQWGNCFDYCCNKTDRTDSISCIFVEINSSPLSNIDWEQRRYELSKAALQRMLTIPEIYKDSKYICKSCIGLADEMIEQLKHE